MQAHLRCDANGVVKPKSKVLDRRKRGLNRAQDERALQHGELVSFASKVVEKLSFVDVVSLCSASIAVSNGEKICGRGVMHNVRQHCKEKKMGAGSPLILFKEPGRV